MNIQQEIRVLNSSVELITSYVNYAICCFPEDRAKLVTSVLPQDNTAKKYFFILLLEIIAGVNKEIVPEKSDGDSLLRLLHKISISPQLDCESENTVALKKSVEEFETWLSHEFEYEIYSANIGKELKIRLSRQDAIYLIGNRCKHSLPRSNAILQKIVKTYRKSGVDLEPGTEILILEDIDNWLFDDFGGYHFTKLCELSAKVYYGIVQYIRPVYVKCLVRADEVRYSYKMPNELTEEDSKFEYYELLNRTRSPFLPKIETWEHLEGRY
ncbi:MAG: hypothetical protein LH702_15160 [Phormidesmis sp. CAN_BIN44]|nr:hypothetical protein [Phormidesmis sp. CAN_BIN44]